MYFETEQVANLYLEHQDWNVVGQLIVDKNIMQKGTISTRKREFAEIKKRLKHLNDDELKFITECTMDELKLFCLYLCSRTYRLLYEFIVEVVREKYLMFDYSILDSDYARFIESKTASSIKLQNITETTQYGIKNLIFRMLAQSGLIGSVKAKNIQKPYIPKKLETIVANYSVKYLAVFLYSDTDIKNIKEGLNV